MRVVARITLSLPCPALHSELYPHNGPHNGKICQFASAANLGIMTLTVRRIMEHFRTHGVRDTMVKYWRLRGLPMGTKVGVDGHGNEYYEDPV